MPEIDGQWFKDMLRDKRMSQRQLGRLIGMDASSLTLLLQGKRRMTADRAADIARVLSLPLEDVMSHSGVQHMPSSEGKVPIVGVVDGEAEATVLSRPMGYAVMPGPLDDGSVAFTMRTTESALDMMNGWILFAGPEQDSIDANAIDRTAIVKARGMDRPSMRLIRRGTLPDTYTLTCVTKSPIHDANVEWFRRVKLMRPI